MQSPNGSGRTQLRTPTRMLLIEDVVTAAEIVKAYIEAVPGAVLMESVGSLSAALERIANIAFDLIMADLNLPDSKGLETLDRLTQATDGLIIVLAIEDSPQLREAAMTMSHSQLKVKPVAGIIMRPFSVEQERAASHG